jgi:hypothetical protein
MKFRYSQLARYSGGAFSAVPVGPGEYARHGPARLPVPILRRLGRVGTSLKPLEQIVLVKPADTQGAGMAGTDRPATPVGGGAGGAAIGRDVADRQRLATVLGDGF